MRIIIPLGGYAMPPPPPLRLPITPPPPSAPPTNRCGFYQRRTVDDNIQAIVTSAVPPLNPRCPLHTRTNSHGCCHATSRTTSSAARPSLGHISCPPKRRTHSLHTRAANAPRGVSAPCAAPSATSRHSPSTMGRGSGCSRRHGAWPPPPHNSAACVPAPVRTQRRVHGRQHCQQNLILAASRATSCAKNSHRLRDTAAVQASERHTLHTRAAPNSGHRSGVCGGSSSAVAAPAISRHVRHGADAVACSVHSARSAGSAAATTPSTVNGGAEAAAAAAAAPACDAPIRRPPDSGGGAGGVAGTATGVAAALRRARTHAGIPSGVVAVAGDDDDDVDDDGDDDGAPKLAAAATDDDVDDDDDGDDDGAPKLAAAANDDDVDVDDDGDDDGGGGGATTRAGTGGDGGGGTEAAAAAAAERARRRAMVRLKRSLGRGAPAVVDDDTTVAAAAAAAVADDAPLITLCEETTRKVSSAFENTTPCSLSRPPAHLGHEVDTHCFPRRPRVAAGGRSNQLLPALEKGHPPHRLLASAAVLF